MLKEFLRQCQQLNPDLALQDDKAIQLIQESLDDCLRSYCQRLVYAELDQFDHEQLGSRQANLFAGGRQNFMQAVENYLEQSLDLPPASLEVVRKKIAEVISEWLHFVSYSND